MQAKAKQITERVVVITLHEDRNSESAARSNRGPSYEFFHFHLEPLLVIASLTDTLGIATVVLKGASMEKFFIFRYSGCF